MHTLGKVLLGFAVVGALAAIVLTTLTLGVRTKWQSQVDQARQEFQQVEADLQIKRTQMREAQEHLDRVKRGWGNVYMAPNSRPTNPAIGAVNIGVGTQMGLGVPAASRPANPTLYIFNVNGDESEFLGEFNLQSAQAGSADAVLTRPPFPGENFPPGTWRVRDEIPYDYLTRFIDLRTKQDEADIRLERMHFDIKRLETQLATSQQLLQERLYQLEGDPNLESPNELQKAGFVQALRDQSMARDQKLAVLHAKRLELRLKFETLQMLVQENASRLAAYEQQIRSGASAAPLSTAGRTAADEAN